MRECTWVHNLQSLVDVSLDVDVPDLELSCSAKKSRVMGNLSRPCKMQKRNGTAV